MYMCVCPPQAVPGGGVQRQTLGAVGHQDRDTSSRNGQELSHCHCAGTTVLDISEIWILFLFWQFYVKVTLKHNWNDVLVLSIVDTSVGRKSVNYHPFFFFYV